ncbi:MAG TPA: hypothetical protein VFX59_11885 [Polyangiales bacterium]|nr:hypothetical protein [Polyangiales bacterium]
MLKDEPATLTQRSAHPLDRGFLGTCSVLAVAVACSIAVIAAPRPVQPSRLPALRVPLAEGRRAFGEHALDPRPLPQAAWFERWYELYNEAGLNERERAVDLSLVAAQRSELARISRESFPKLGDAGVRALMDTLTARALDALTRRDPPTEAYGLLGGFPALLAHYGYTDEAYTPIAPPRVIENLYRQRFNLISERPLDSDIDRADRALAEGWIALHGERLPNERRAKAAQTFAQLGGIDAREALAIWLYHGELKDDAIALLERAYERSGALRIRNMLLFLRRT